MFVNEYTLILTDSKPVCQIQLVMVRFHRVYREPAHHCRLLLIEISVSVSGRSLLLGSFRAGLPAITAAFLTVFFSIYDRIVQ